MEQIPLKASVRTEKGKQAVKHLRKKGLIPGVVYHRGEEAVPVSLPSREFSQIVRHAGGENLLIKLTVEKEKKAKPRAVLIKEVQHHPVSRDILHVDFNEISLTEKITVEVEIRGQGEPVGVKQDGGILEHGLRAVKIECLPTDIPPHLDVDVSALKLNDAVHVRDIALPEHLKMLSDPDTLLFQVKLHEEKIEEAAPAEPQEVEVLREKKEEEAAPGEKPKEEAKEKETPKAQKQ